MSETPYHIVNAFTAEGQHGNPAAVVVDTNALTEVAMQSMAAKIGLSETAFVQDSDIADYKIRFFTPTTEMDLCGHATIATWSLLHKLGKVPTGSYVQETGAGILAVDVQDNLTFMEQAKAAFYETVSAADIAPLLGITTEECSETLPMRVVSTGVKDLLVPITDKMVLAGLRPDLDGIEAFSKQHDISGFHVFTLLDNEQSTAAARNFAPKDGIPEESATGTSNGALLCYLKQQGVLPQKEVHRIEQGEAMGQLSYIYGKFVGDTVWIGGQATIIQ
jgi:PhzF family phenazine biosynthesis protein